MDEIECRSLVPDGSRYSIQLQALVWKIPRQALLPAVRLVSI